MTFAITAAASQLTAHNLGTSPSEQVAPNPQSFEDRAIIIVGGKSPLPPKELGANALSSLLDKVALNPQPLPPKELGLNTLSSAFEKVALNPQPLPPKELGLNALSSALDKVAINPQPLPPGGGEFSGLLKVADDEGCGNVPRRLPHFPPAPPPGPWNDIVSSALAIR